MSELEVSDLEVKVEFYLSDVVSKNITQQNPNNTLIPLFTHPIAGPTPTLNNVGRPRQKRHRRTQFTKEFERAHYLHLIAKDVVNVGGHLVHRNTVLTKDELCVLSLGTTFVPNDACFATFDIEIITRLHLSFYSIRVSTKPYYLKKQKINSPLSLQLSR